VGILWGTFPPAVTNKESINAGANILQQQAKFDDFIEEFNQQRPHEALGMKCPAELYIPSPRPYHGLPEPHYPFHDRTVTVSTCGRLCLYRKKINLSTSLAGQAVGVKEVDHGNLAGQLYGLRFGLYRLGGKNFAAPRQPLWAKSVTYVLGPICYLSVRSGHCAIWRALRDLNPRPSDPKSDALSS
jgi:hypothetical protein